MSPGNLSVPNVPPHLLWYLYALSKQQQQQQQHQIPNPNISPDIERLMAAFNQSSSQMIASAASDPSQASEASAAGFKSVKSLSSRGSHRGQPYSVPVAGGKEQRTAKSLDEITGSLLIRNEIRKAEVEGRIGGNEGNGGEKSFDEEQLNESNLDDTSAGSELGEEVEQGGGERGLDEEECRENGNGGEGEGEGEGEDSLDSDGDNQQGSSFLNETTAERENSN